VYFYSFVSCICARTFGVLTVDDILMSVEEHVTQLLERLALQFKQRTQQGFAELRTQFEQQATVNRERERVQHFGQDQQLGADGGECHNRRIDDAALPGENEDHAARLINALQELIDGRKLPTRDQHEIKLLIAVLDEADPAEKRNLLLGRLEVLYIANTRGWAQAAAHARKELDSELGLPPIQPQPQRQVQRRQTPYKPKTSGQGRSQKKKAT
jgi:hypothetical protein